MHPQQFLDRFCPESDGTEVFVDVLFTLYRARSAWEAECAGRPDDADDFRDGRSAIGFARWLSKQSRILERRKGSGGRRIVGGLAVRLPEDWLADEDLPRLRVINRRWRDECVRHGCTNALPSRRINRRFCSDACRQAVYRKRWTLEDRRLMEQLDAAKHRIDTADPGGFERLEQLYAAHPDRRPAA